MPVVFVEILHSDFEVENSEPFLAQLEAKTRTNYHYMQATYFTAINPIPISAENKIM
jgi:hypothetical protein